MTLLSSAYNLEYGYYSPSTCCFLPASINVAMRLDNYNKFSDLPVGVKYRAKTPNVPYSANLYLQTESIFLGSYSTVDKAFDAYRKAKEGYIYSLAESYKNLIPEYIYNNLMNYSVDKYRNKRGSI